MSAKENYTLPTEELVDGVASFYESDFLCDGELEAEGKVFKVHRFLLAAVSPYFRTMYNGNFKESGNDPVKLQVQYYRVITCWAICKHVLTNPIRQLYSSLQREVPQRNTSYQSIW